MKRITSASAFTEWRDALKAAAVEDRMVTVCGGTGCVAFGGPKVKEAFRDELRKHGLEGKVQVKATGCHGFCEQGPVVVIEPSKIFYPGVKIEDVPEIVERSVIGDEIVEKLLYVDPATERKIALDHDVPFYAGQQRIVFRLN